MTSSPHAEPTGASSAAAMDASSAVETAGELANVAGAMFGLLSHHPAPLSLAPQLPEPSAERRVEETTGAVDRPSIPTDREVPATPPALTLPASIALPVPGPEPRTEEHADRPTVPAAIPVPTMSDGPVSAPAAPAAPASPSVPVSAPVAVPVPASPSEKGDLGMLREIGFLDD